MSIVCFHFHKVMTEQKNLLNSSIRKYVYLWVWTTPQTVVQTSAVNAHQHLKVDLNQARLKNKMLNEQQVWEQKNLLMFLNLTHLKNLVLKHPPTQTNQTMTQAILRQAQSFQRLSKKHWTYGKNIQISQ